jgi:hypothetical protein
MTEYKWTFTYVGYCWFHFGCVYCNFEKREIFMWPCITSLGEVTNNFGTCFIGLPLVGKDIVLTFIVNYNPFVVCLFLSWPSLLGIQSKKKSKLVILAHQHKENVWNVFKINEYVLFIRYSLKINKNIIKPSWNTQLLLIFWQIVFLDGRASIMLLPSSTQCTFLMFHPKKKTIGPQ